MAEFMAVDFTDGRTTQTLVFDADGDTEASAARLTEKMAKDGMRPVKGSQRMIERHAFKVREPRHWASGPAFLRTKRHSIPSATR